MALASDKNVYGRMRQRIVTIGRVDPRRGVLTRGHAHFAKDKQLRALLRSGAVTQRQLETAISGITKAPSNFTWLTEVSEAVLEKADRVFAVKYGRAPVENEDFHLNGDYHKICRSLQFDVHRYDDRLDELSEVDSPEGQAQAEEPGTIDRAGPPRTEPLEGRPQASETRQGVRQEPQKRGLWPFVAVLLVGFCSAPILAMMIATYFSGPDMLVGLGIAGCWLLVLLGALVMTFPRQTIS